MSCSTVQRRGVVEVGQAVTIQDVGQYMCQGKSMLVVREVGNVIGRFVRAVCVGVCVYVCICCACMCVYGSE